MAWYIKQQGKHDRSLDAYIPLFAGVVSTPTIGLMVHFDSQKKKENVSRCMKMIILWEWERHTIVTCRYALPKRHGRSQTQSSKQVQTLCILLMPW